MRHGRWLRVVKFALLTLMMLLSRRSPVADGAARAPDLDPQRRVQGAAPSAANENGRPGEGRPLAVPVEDGAS